MRRRAAPVLLAAALAGCAPTAALMTPPPTVNPGPGQGEEVTGEVAFSAGGLGSAVRYGPWRVRGEGLDLGYAGDGAWAGTWNGNPARFTTQAGLIQGPGTQLTLAQGDAGLRIRGVWGGRTVDLSVGRLSLAGSADQGRCTYSLSPAGANVLRGLVGCSAAAGAKATANDGSLRFGGEAALVPDVLLPHFVLALLHVLPTAVVASP
ncbi:MAG: hypothetical protein WB493_03875 [Anaeromyxobacteraceae bacterium]